MADPSDAAPETPPPGSAGGPAPGALSWLPLPGLGLLRVVGEEARAFLQGQLTSDLAAVTPARGQLGGYCNPKGRLLAVLVLRQAPLAAGEAGEAFELTLPAELVPVTLKRLRMFVLRSKLRIDDASAARPAIGLLAGEGGEAAGVVEGFPLPAGLVLPTLPYAGTEADGWGVQRLGGTSARWLLRGPADAVQAWAAQTEFAPCDPAAWQRAAVAAGVPEVVAGTVEHFVPQTVDLDRADGLSFTKGCYPGQEIVARVHYLGKLKSRLHRARVQAGTPPPAPGTPVLVAGGDGQAVGEVVLAVPGASAEEGGSLLLTLGTVHTGSVALRLGSVDGPALKDVERVHVDAADIVA